MSLNRTKHIFHQLFHLHSTCILDFCCVCVCWLKIPGKTLKLAGGASWRRVLVPKTKHENPRHPLETPQFQLRLLVVSEANVWLVEGVGPFLSSVKFSQASVALWPINRSMLVWNPFEVVESNHFPYNRGNNKHIKIWWNLVLSGCAVYWFLFVLGGFPGGLGTGGVAQNPMDFHGM